MKTHSLKIFPGYFESVVDGSKTFEVRLNDRDYKAEDRIVLNEYDLVNKRYTGRKTERVITYIEQIEKFVVLGMRATTDGWIPCSERLPKEEKQYEVTIRRKHESFNRVGARHFVKPSYSARGVWLDSSLCETVLAWRDMPEPWKGEE